MNTINYLLPIFIIVCFLLVVNFLVQYCFPKSSFIVLRNKTLTTFIALIFWLSVGFIYSLDYNNNYGCMIYEDTDTYIIKIIFSSISAIFLCGGFYWRDRNVGIILLLLELIFWLYKLFVLKGGYAVGFGAVPSFEVVNFDIIALALRLILIKQVKQIRIKSFFLFIVGLSIIYIKVQYFSIFF